MPVRVIASSLALIGFMVAAVTGAIAGNPATTTITRALTAMGICYLVGLGIGRLGQAAVREHVERYKQANPIPEVDADAGDDGSPSHQTGAEETATARHADDAQSHRAPAGAAQG